MAVISDVFILDVSDKLQYRKTKHCVCISVSENKCLLINSNNRGIYNELEIKASDYKFLNGANRFIACLRTIKFEEREIIKKVGSLNYSDMVKITERLKMVKNKDILIQLEDIIAELEKWLSNYVANKLSGSFSKR